MDKKEKRQTNLLIAVQCALWKGYEPILPVSGGARGDVRGEHLAQAARAPARHRRARRRQQRVAVAAVSASIATLIQLIRIKLFTKEVFYKFFYVLFLVSILKRGTW